MTIKSLVIAGAIVLAGAHAALATTITTPTIIGGTTAAAVSCMRWTPIGMCFWLRCGFRGCRVRSSLKVGHYNPDLVVAAYNKLGGNPWLEMRHTLGLAQTAAVTSLLGSVLRFPVESGANRSEGGRGLADHRNLMFRESDAIGHPMSTFTRLSFGTICQSQATPFVPYFQSGIDALAWRTPIPEAFFPDSLIPGRRELGPWPVQTWGSVYPRGGWTIQAEEPKAAAINAQRVGDIVTRPGQAHVYLPLSGPLAPNQRVWPPGALLERDARTGTWQMLSPKAETRCSVFGDNDLQGPNSWSSGRVDPNGEYVWNLWRPYKCCDSRGQWFLFDVDWSAYPP